jgi:hypothetical protein
MFVACQVDGNPTAPVTASSSRGLTDELDCPN